MDSKEIFDFITGFSACVVELNANVTTEICFRIISDVIAVQNSKRIIMSIY